MTEIINTNFEETSAKIAELRDSGNIADALQVATSAVKSFPTSYLFPKVAGDLFFQRGDYKNASEYYVQFLKKTPPNEKLFEQFARRYYRLKRNWSKPEIGEYAKSIAADIKNGEFAYNTAMRATELIKNDIPPESTLSDLGLKLTTLLFDDINFVGVVNTARDLVRWTPSLGQNGGCVKSGSRYPY